MSIPLSVKKGVKGEATGDNGAEWGATRAAHIFGVGCGPAHPSDPFLPLSPVVGDRRAMHTPSLDILCILVCIVG